MFYFMLEGNGEEIKHAKKLLLTSSNTMKSEK
jgi:hypothetical protein